MPVQSNNVLDDPILLDGNDSFVGGQVSSTRANLISDNAYAEGRNIDLDEFGKQHHQYGTGSQHRFLAALILILELQRTLCCQMARIT